MLAACCNYQTMSEITFGKKLASQQVLIETYYYSMRCDKIWLNLMKNELLGQKNCSLFNECKFNWFLNLCS